MAQTRPDQAHGTSAQATVTHSHSQVLVPNGGCVARRASDLLPKRAWVSDRPSRRAFVGRSVPAFFNAVAFREGPACNLLRLRHQ